jgi:predicted dehydrogenase
VEVRNMIKLGFSGGGYWGSNLVRAALKIPDVKVVSIADPDPGARGRISSLVNGDIRTHAQFDYLLSDKIDAVVIATPPSLHVEQAVAALGRGKAVFLEKPPAMSIPDLERLLNAARGKTLVCDYIYCYNALIQYAKKLMNELDFVLVMADLHWTNWGIVRRDVDAWWSVGPHPISILCYLFDQNINMDWCIHGNGYARTHLSVGQSSILVSATWHHPMKRREIELVGVNHSIFIEDVTKMLSIIKHNDLKGRISFPPIDYGEPLISALTDFVKCIKSGEKSVTGPAIIERATRLMCAV